MSFALQIDFSSHADIFDPSRRLDRPPQSRPRIRLVARADGLGKSAACNLTVNIGLSYFRWLLARPSGRRICIATAQAAHPAFNDVASSSADGHLFIALVERSERLTLSKLTVRVQESGRSRLTVEPNLNFLAQSPPQQRDSFPTLQGTRVSARSSTVATR